MIGPTFDVLDHQATRGGGIEKAETRHAIRGQPLLERAPQGAAQPGADRHAEARSGLRLMVVRLAARVGGLPERMALNRATCSRS